MQRLAKIVLFVLAFVLLGALPIASLWKFMIGVFLLGVGLDFVLPRKRGAGPGPGSGYEGPESGTGSPSTASTHASRSGADAGDGGKNV